MKEVKLLDCVQAVLHPSNTLILATIQEYGLKSEFTCNNCYHISLQFENDVFKKSVIVKPLSCKTYNLL